MHGGGPDVSPGQPLADAYLQENVEMVTSGAESNLARHISNARKMGVKVVVALNRFASDTPAEIEAVRKCALAAGADACVPANHWAEGGKGAIDLAQAVVDACAAGPDGVSPSAHFKPLYPLDLSIRDKIATIAREFYGAADVSYTDEAGAQIDKYERQGFGNLRASPDSRT